MKTPPDKLKMLLICAALAAVCLVGYEQLRNNDFVNWDDDQYITKNPNVYTGLTRQNIIWAFTTTDVSYWHPLTWLSHMLDCQLFGTAPAGHHLTSLMLHIANSLLLFILLRQATGAVWKSAFVAALFALHTINTDSVAWVSERKNLLSTLFWMLTTLAYVRYSRHPGLSRYLPVLLLFALGLLAKPALAVLPFVLLLLDYWPLGRLSFGQPCSSNSETSAISSSQGPRNLRLIVEKVPLFILSTVAISLASFSLRHTRQMVSTAEVPMQLRIANALVSCLRYIAKMFVPRSLAVHYPYPDTVPLAQAAAALLLLLCVTALALWLIRKRPYLIVGWLWFLGTLLPVSGLMQAGQWPAMADRFAYVPLIGLFIIITWTACELWAKWRYKRLVLAAAAAVVLLVLLLLTHRQVRLWKDSFTLFAHALKVTENNAEMHNNFANALLRRDKLDEAAEHYREALRISPRHPRAHYNLAYVLQIEGKIDQAISHYRQCIEINPEDSDAHNNLALALVSRGSRLEAIEHYRRALKIKPKDPAVHYNLGVELALQNKISQAIGHFRQALRVSPDFPGARENIDLLLKQKSQLDKKLNRRPGRQDSIK